MRISSPCSLIAPHRQVQDSRKFEKTTKGSLPGFPPCYPISAGRHQPDVTIAGGGQIRRWRSHQTIGFASRIMFVRLQPARPSSDFVRGHTLITAVGPDLGLPGTYRLPCVAKAVVAGAVTELPGRRRLVRELPGISSRTIHGARTELTTKLAGDYPRQMRERVKMSCGCYRRDMLASPLNTK